jgi:regulator of protease activity HflC (stomatin/prohibitin superfamily)
MKKHVAIFLLAVLLVLALLASTVAIKLDTTENAIVRTFGKTTEEYNGARDAGLHFKWPWPVQTVIFYESRCFVFEDTVGEVTTSDKLNVVMTLYCAWEISDPVVFQSKFAAQKAGEDKIREFVRTAKKDVMGSRKMEDLVNTDPAKMRLGDIEKDILAKVASDSTGYGVKVVAVGIKSLGLPENISKAVIDTMKQERQTAVKAYSSAGESMATTIRERAKAAAEKIKAFAEAKAARIRAEGDLAAAKYYGEFAANEEFSKFLRSLESMESELRNNTTILIDAATVPGVDYFRHSPKAAPSSQPAK